MPAPTLQLGDTAGRVVVGVEVVGEDATEGGGEGVEAALVHGVLEQRQHVVHVALGHVTALSLQQKASVWQSQNSHTRKRYDSKYSYMFTRGTISVPCHDWLNAAISSIAFGVT